MYLFLFDFEEKPYHWFRFFNLFLEPLIAFMVKPKRPKLCDYGFVQNTDRKQLYVFWKTLESITKKELIIEMKSQIET